MSVKCVFSFSLCLCCLFCLLFIVFVVFGFFSTRTMPKGKKKGKSSVQASTSTTDKLKACNHVKVCSVFHSVL